MALWPRCHHYFAISWIKPSEPWFSLSLSLSPGLLDFFHHLYKACVRYKAFYANSPFSNFMAPPRCIHNQNKRHDKKLLRGGTSWDILGPFLTLTIAPWIVDTKYHTGGEDHTFCVKIFTTSSHGAKHNSVQGQRTVPWAVHSDQTNPSSYKNKCVSEVFSYHDRIKVKATFKSWRWYWTERCTFHLFHAGEV